LGKGSFFRLQFAGQGNYRLKKNKHKGFCRLEKLIGLMQEQEVKFAVDELLEPLLQASDEAHAEQLTEHLLTQHAEPIVRNIIRTKLRQELQEPGRSFFQEAEDVYHEVFVQLLSRLAQFRRVPGEKPIQNFCSYVAVTAYRACNDFLRSKYPKRYSLKNKIRYFLNHQQGFAVWQDQQENWLCGFQHWQTRFTASAQSLECDAQNLVRLRELREQPKRFVEALLPNQSASSLQLEALLTAIFKWLDAPIEIDQLLTIVAELWEVKDLPKAGPIEGVCMLAAAQ
jgi:DNA-directed RNA polymerase specialized sigma24 family protein